MTKKSPLNLFATGEDRHLGLSIQWVTGEPPVWVGSVTEIPHGASAKEIAHIMARFGIATLKHLEANPAVIEVEAEVVPDDHQPTEPPNHKPESA